MKKDRKTKRVKALKNEFKTIQHELVDLDKFRDTKPLEKFRRQLQGELSHLKERIKKLTITKKEKNRSRIEKLRKANKNRSSKNIRVWNYVKSIQRNYFPDKSIKEIRTSLKKHRQGLETDIKDVIWRNPSP